jgi:hypothetical protein
VKGATASQHIVHSQHIEITANLCLNKNSTKVVLGSFVVQGVKSFVAEWWLTCVRLRVALRLKLFNN